MPKRSSIKRDTNQAAFSVVQQATAPEPTQPAKNPAAVALGRLGGIKGGKARAKKLSAKQRYLIASKAAKAKWQKYRKTNS